MSALPVLKPKTATGNGVGAAARARDWLSPLNLHWAGLGLLALVNIYLLAQMGLLWHAASGYNANAMAEQRIELKTAEMAAAPLRGLDAKLVDATAQADRFYRQRLPGSDSEVASELGVLTKNAGVRLGGAQYAHATVLAGSKGELTELNIDARLSGDYRPLMKFINTLERDKMFFVINAVTLSGQQTGTVNLRLRLKTYLRDGGMQGASADVATDAAADAAATGGPGR